MQAFYDHKPSALEAVGNGSYLYRWELEEVAAPAMGAAASDEQAKALPESSDIRTQWRCREVTVYEPLTANKLTLAVIESIWGGGIEQKMLNDWNAVQLGILPEAPYKENYVNFLTERKRLKEEIDALFDERGK